MRPQLGRAGPLLIALALLTPLPALLTPSRPPGPPALTLWTFDPASAAAYPSTISGHPLHAAYAPAPILNARLGARALNLKADGDSGGGAHLVELDITSVGKYFRGPAEATYLLPLPPLPTPSDLLESRLAVWRYQGLQLALPRDVHPVLIAYRSDLWTEAGLDPAAAQSWPDLIRLCRAYEAYHTQHGRPDRKSLELPRTSAALVALLLQQRNLTLLDELSRPKLTDPKVADTILQYAEWLAPPATRNSQLATLGASPARTLAQTADDLTTGRLAALPLPDWKLGRLRALAPHLKGRLALMPLPAFSDTERATPTWGGSALAVPRDTPDPAASLALLRDLYADPDLAVDRYRRTLILPPTPALWSDPRLASEDAFFTGPTPLSRLLPDLASRLAPQIVTPLTPLAQFELNQITARTVAAYATDTALAREQLTRDLEAAQLRLTERADELHTPRP